MAIEAPPKPKDNTEKLIEAFYQWADERIADYENIPSVSAHSWTEHQTKIATLQFAKANLERLAKEIKGEVRWLKKSLNLSQILIP